MTLSGHIQLTRQQKNLYQKELADKSGVNLKSLSRYELGSSMPPADTLKEIAGALGVSADYLLDEQNIPVRDKKLLKKFEAIQDLQGDAKKLADNFLDMINKDHQTKKVYAS